MSAVLYLQRTTPLSRWIPIARERVPYSISLNGLRVTSAFWGGPWFNGVLVTTNVLILEVQFWAEWRGLAKASQQGKGVLVTSFNSKGLGFGLQPYRGCHDCL